MAHSIASAPEFAKNTKSAKLCSHSLAASRSPSGLLNRFDMCHSRVVCSCKADQVRMAVAQRIDRNTAGEIEIALAIGRDQPCAFAALETEVDPGEYREQMRRGAVGHGDHCRLGLSHHARIGAIASTTSPGKTKRAAFSRRHAGSILCPRRYVSTGRWNSTPWKKRFRCVRSGRCGRSKADSCAGVTAYCSLRAVGY